ncbi:MAG: EAL domain-containing protein [Pacificimonas sp.]
MSNAASRGASRLPRGEAARFVAAAKLKVYDTNVRLAIFGNVINAVLISIVMYPHAPNWAIAAANTFILSAVGLRLWAQATYRRDLRENIQLKRHIKLAAWTAGYSGGSWSLAIILMSSYGGAAEMALLAMVGCGMMAASALNMGHIPAAVRAYGIATAVGGMVAFLRIGGLFGFVGSALILCFLVILDRSVARASRTFVAMTLRTRALQTMRDTVHMLLKDFEDQGSDWLWEVNDRGLVVAPSARFAEAARRPLETLPDRRFVTLFEPGPERDRLSDHIERGRSFSDLTLSLVIAGEQRWWSLSGRAVPARRHRQSCFRGVAMDITDAQQAESKVAYMAHYDSLTDLANRFLFSETITRRANDITIQGDFAVLYLDLDDFKAVNDTLGHSVGDRVLQRAARRIQRCADGNDLVARLGGDEFAVLVQNDVSETSLEARAQCIVDALSEPMDVGQHHVVTGGSIGIARSDKVGDDVEELMRAADLALYAAKAAGRGTYRHYVTAMDDVAQKRRQIEMDLRAALERGQLSLAFQPLVSVATGETVSYEALMRWDHPERGAISPEQFIPIAEETGLIVSLGEWVLREAISELANWPDEISVSVNLSPAQMQSPSLISTIISALATTGVAADRLELEITEGVLMHDGEANIATLKKVHDLGVRIALDDFGTGYSSLNYLRSFPFDKIKIDKCFVAELADREDCRAIVRAVTELASSLGMTTTAEGVETQSQFDQLAAEGCDQVQGFLFAKAQPAHTLTDLRSPEPVRPEVVASLLSEGVAEVARQEEARAAAR